MKRVIFLLTVTAIFFVSCSKEPVEGYENELVIDHSSTDLTEIPANWVSAARASLHIAYGHTSHGSQLTTGMTGLVSFRGDEYSWNNGGIDGALDLHDYAMPGDLGNPDFTTWESETRSYLAQNSDVNVIIWSWCGEVSSATEEQINTYLSLMNGLEQDFPAVVFVYMTGHLDGTGLTGNLHIRNEQIRNYCHTYGKVLYDFADIESYNPDGVWFGDRSADDACAYDSNNDGTRDANWAIEWQDSHTLGTDWYECTSAHSQPLNANMKAYAAWYLWARLAGWDGR